VSEDWRDGKIVDFSFLSEWNLVSGVIYGSVAYELLLAILLILRLRISILAIVVFHLGIVVLVPSTIHHAFSLAVYGGIMAYMAYWACPITLSRLWDFLQGRKQLPRRTETAFV